LSTSWPCRRDILTASSFYYQMLAGAPPTLETLPFAHALSHCHLPPDCPAVTHARAHPWLARLTCDYPCFHVRSQATRAARCPARMRLHRQPHQDSPRLHVQVHLKLACGRVARLRATSGSKTAHPIDTIDDSISESSAVAVAAAVAARRAARPPRMVQHARRAHGTRNARGRMEPVSRGDGWVALESPSDV